MPNKVIKFDGSQKISPNSTYFPERMTGCTCDLLHVEGKGYQIMSLNSDCPCSGHGINSSIDRTSILEERIGNDGC